MTTPHLPARAALAGLALLGLTLTACSGSGDDTSDSPHKEAAPPSAPASASSKVPSGDNGKIKDPTGDIAALSDFACDKNGKSWSATGRLENTTDGDATYLLQVSVHSASAGTVFGSAEKTFELAAGKKTKFSLDDIYSGREKKVDCTPRVVRGS